MKNRSTQYLYDQSGKAQGSVDLQIISSEEMSKDFMEEAALKLRLEKYLGLGVFETSLFAF